MERSKARNHHYISQVEQRLNAIDKSVSSENQRIFKFEVVDAESKIIKNLDLAGKKIEKNLAIKDLYALKMLEGGGQENLEAAFQVYENDIGELTKSLLEKIADPNSTDFKVEILRLYLLKFLNSFRNPYSIKKTLHTLASLKGVVPGSAQLAENFSSIDDGRRSQVARICREYGVSEDEYIEWLKAIYLLILQPLDNGLNLLETMVKSLVENERLVKDITVFSYDNEGGGVGILLCDRGMVEGNVDDGVLIQLFNLDANNFVSFMFIDVAAQQIVPVPPRYLEGIERLAKETKVSNPVNDMNMLAAYNRYCVWQAASHVYCSRVIVFGIEVIH